jgi:mono/diheme cytochrome c family protein
MNPERSPRTKILWAAVLALGVAGCTGQISDAGGPPPPPDTEAKLVPASPEVVAGDGACVDFLAGERLLSVSPEGHAWLVREQDGASLLRVLDAFDDKNEVVAKVELSGIQRIVPWSQVDASVTTDTGLWKLEDLARVELTPPTGFSNNAALCGDPTTNGSLLFGGKLFERRDDAQWWSWSSGASGSAAPSELLLQQGECEGPDDVEWMTSTDGTLWRVEPSAVFRPIKFESLKAAAVTTGPALNRDVMLGVLDGEELWVGPDAWQRWTFPNGAPAHLTAAGGFLWLTSGAAVLRFDGVAWTEVQLSSAPSGAAEGLFAYDGGVWISQSGSVCHVSATPSVRVTGIRPFLRSKELDHGFSLAASDAGEALTATLDGEALALSVDAATGVTTGSARLDQPGWHQLTATAGTATRSIWLKRLPDAERSWATDIEPIFQKHCADCHTTGQAPGGPVLASYEAWTARAKQLQARVVDAKNMPPAANRSPDWSDAEVQIIAEWLAGGMAP